MKAPLQGQQITAKNPLDDYVNKMNLNQLAKPPAPFATVSNTIGGASYLSASAVAR